MGFFQSSGRATERGLSILSLIFGFIGFIDASLDSSISFLPISSKVVLRGVSGYNNQVFASSTNVVLRPLSIILLNGLFGHSTNCLTTLSSPYRILSAIFTISCLTSHFKSKLKSRSICKAATNPAVGQISISPKQVFKSCRNFLCLFSLY